MLVSFIEFVDARKAESCLIGSFHNSLLDKVFVSKVDWNSKYHAWKFRKSFSHLLNSLNVDIFYSSLIFFDLIRCGRELDYWSKSSFGHNEWRFAIKKIKIIKRFGRIV